MSLSGAPRRPSLRSARWRLPRSGPDRAALTRDAGCIRDLQWRTELDPEVDLERLLAALANERCEVRAPAPGLRMVETEDGHVMVVVPRTGRVQIRVSYLVPQPERAAAAEEVYARLVRAMRVSRR